MLDRRGLVDIKGFHAVLKRLRVVGGLIVDNAQQMLDPRSDLVSTTRCRNFLCLDRQPERILRISRELSKACQAVERSCLTKPVTLGARHRSRLQGTSPGFIGMGIAHGRCAFEQVAYFARASWFRGNRLRFHGGLIGSVRIAT